MNEEITNNYIYDRFTMIIIGNPISHVLFVGFMHNMATSLGNICISLKRFSKDKSFVIY